MIEKIYTDGLDEGIRCAMCTNTMKSDRGCDGGCVVNDAMYKRVMEVISKAIVQEVAKEYGKDTNVRSNGRKLNRCDTCTYYVADTVPPICYFCSKGIEDNYKARETK